MYQRIIRPVLFLFSPESIHNFVFICFRIAKYVPLIHPLLQKLYAVRNKKLQTTVLGLHFPNPVGLAAGMDKNAEAYDIIGSMGFGFVEIGTITPLPQPGNDKPRVFRLKKDQALINRMGFNNKGVDYAVSKLKRKATSVLVGGNIGKNKLTLNEHAIDDYLISFRKLHPFVDYFAVNVSSPNTPNLRELQEKEPLKELLLALRVENQKQEVSKPILLKIAPDLTNEQLNDIVDIIEETNTSGIIACNTTIERTGLSYPEEQIKSIGAGGLSGRVLKDRSTEVIRYLAQKSKGKFPIIAVGGIFSPEDAWEKMQAGASLVQLYTGFVYEGPGLAKKINQFLLTKENWNEQK